jgi:hypothetical protein
LNDFISLNCTLYVGYVFVSVSYVFQRDRSNHIVYQAMRRMSTGVGFDAYLCFSEAWGGHVADIFVWQVWLHLDDPHGGLGASQ